MEDLFDTNMDNFEDLEDFILKDTAEEEQIIDDEPIEDESLESVDGEEHKGGQDGEDVIDDTSSLLFSFASALAEDGVLPSLDLQKEPIKSTDDLINAIKREIEKNEFSDLTETQRQALEAFRNGVTVEEFKEAKLEETKLSSISNDDLEEDLDLRKELIKRDFLSKGYSETKAERLTQRSFDLGEDLEDAKEALDVQKRLAQEKIQSKIRENKQREQEQLESNKKQLEKLKETVYDEKVELIPGFKFNKNIADQVYESMTKVVEVADGVPLNKIMKDRMKDPVGFEHKLHYVYTITKGFTDFSKLKSNAKSDAIKDFEEKLNFNTVNPKQNRRIARPDLDLLERLM